MKATIEKSKDGKTYIVTHGRFTVYGVHYFRIDDIGVYLYDKDNKLMGALNTKMYSISIDI